MLVVSTGGMSHQLHGPRFGFLNPDWDNEFMDRLEGDPISLTRLTHAQYMERGGARWVEIVMWLAMRGALGEKVRRVHRHYYAPMLTGYGLVAFEARLIRSGRTKMGIRTGRQYLNSLRDDRQMWIDGECVKDVTQDRRFAAAAHTMARSTRCSTIRRCATR